MMKIKNLKIYSKKYYQSNNNSKTFKKKIKKFKKNIMIQKRNIIKLLSLEFILKINRSFIMIQKKRILKKQYFNQENKMKNYNKKIMILKQNFKNYKKIIIYLNKKLFFQIKKIYL